MTRLTLILFLGVVLLTSSCFDPPEIPVTPSISLKSFTFKNIPNNQIQDSMILELNFEDGDGDLGLGDNEFAPPFHEFDYVLSNQNEFLKLGDPGTPPYNCYDYQKVGEDTFYVTRNDYHFNIHLDFYRKVNGEFQRFDLRDQGGCIPGFRGRFFRLNTSSNERPITGVLRWGIQSAFAVIFRNDTLKFDAFIYDRNEQSSSEDRDLNKSNVVESREFTLSEFLGEI